MKIEGNTLHDKLTIIPSKNKAQLEITTLGGLSIHFGGYPLAKFHSRKAKALLVYLAQNARSQPREVLAALFWENLSQNRAMNNLRVVLSNLRKHLGDYLRITRDTAGMSPDKGYFLDVAALDAKLNLAEENERKAGALNHAAIARIEEAVELYKGEFLSGFFVENALEFDAWVVVERERYHYLVLDGLGKLVRWELAQGEYTAGIRHATKWIELAPFSEAAHRQMMRLLVISGERSAALAQYEKCRGILAQELGVEPDTKTMVLYQEIKDGSLGSTGAIWKHFSLPDGGAADIRRHNLPVQTTPFIGRETELENLSRLITDPNVRLVTILGAGGMGKTRLALEVGEALLDQFADGVFFIPMVRLQSGELIVPTIIQALGIEFAGVGAGSGESPTVLKASLLSNLRRKQMLLILDNFEHLLDGVGLVSEIIQTAPGVKILATSRTRLNVSEENRFPIVGMSVPAADKIDDAQQHGAIRLFLQSARRALLSFELTQDELVHITRICRLMEGMPLGIRLAAGWVEVLSPEEIATEIAKGIDLLETDMRDFPERHRSIRALYDHSWNLLNSKEQAVFQAFSVFRGGCSREAAQEITGARLRDLRRLVEKSLLHRTLNRRYEIHELTREYAAEKLHRTPEIWESVHSKHSSYYNNAVRGWGDALKSQRQFTALKEMDLEIDNARAAWKWAVDKHRADLIACSMEGFRHYFYTRTRWQEAEKVFRKAAESFKSGCSKVELRIYARLISMQAFFLELNIRKQDLLQQSLKVLKKLEMSGEDVRFEKAQTINFLSYTISDFEETIDLHQDSLALFRELGDPYWIAHSLYTLGVAYLMAGKMADAEKNFQESIAIFDELGDRRLSTFLQGYFSLIFIRQGKFEKAERNARERMEVLEQIGDTYMIAVGQSEMAECLIALGKFEKAERLLEKALAIHRESENYIYFFGTLFDLCRTKINLGKYVQAYNLARSALDISNELSQTSTGLAVVGWDTNRRRLGFSLTLQGMASLALGKVDEAENSLHQSHEALQGIHPISLSVYHYFLLGIVYLKLNQPEKAKVHIRDSMQKGVKINSALVHIPTIGSAALYFADQGDLERAIEIYALARRYPLIEKSQWFQDVIDQPLKNLTASLSPKIIAEAQKRGRERDLEETVQELFVELQ